MAGSGGRQAGVRYEMAAPRSYGTGRRPTTMRYDELDKPLERQVLEFWRDLISDIRDRRAALGLNQQARQLFSAHSSV